MNCKNDSDDEEKTDKYTCLCSENTCTYLNIVKHIPTKTYKALGSISYLRFNEENGAELYYRKTSLVFKANKFTKILIRNVMAVAIYLLCQEKAGGRSKIISTK